MIKVVNCSVNAYYHYGVECVLKSIESSMLSMHNILVICAVGNYCAQNIKDVISNNMQHEFDRIYLINGKVRMNILIGNPKLIQIPELITPQELLKTIRMKKNKPTASEVFVSEREEYIVNSLKNYINQTIMARHVGISVKTISQYKNIYMRKLDLKNNVDFIKFINANEIYGV